MKVNGQSDVPNGFLLEGTLTGKAFGQIGTLDAVLNNYLLGVCVTANGAPLFGFSEDLSKLDQAAEPACNLGAFKHPKGAVASGVTSATRFSMPAGVPATMLAVRGAGSPPSVKLSRGGRTMIATASSQPRSEGGALVFSNRATSTTYIGLTHPRAGRWTVNVLPGSSAIAELRWAVPKPSAHLQAKVARRQCEDVVHYRLKRSSGERTLLYAEQGSGHVYVGAPHAGSGTLRMKLLTAIKGTGKLVAYYLHGQTPVSTSTVASFADAANNGSEAPSKLTLTRTTLHWAPACAAARYSVRITHGRTTTSHLTSVPQLTLPAGKGKAKVTVLAVAANGETLGSTTRTVG
jgi:hypothetical protein